MKILDIRPAPAGAATRALARFDAEVGGHLRLYNLSLRIAGDGRHWIVAPNACGKHAASFHPDLASAITAAAVAALESAGGRKPHDHDITASG
jgi:hypothetical protein